MICRPVLPSLCLILVWLPASEPVQAGRDCTQKELSAEAIRSGFETGLSLFQYLQDLEDSSGESPKVVLLGRVGSDLSKHGLRFSHMGFAVRDHPAGPYTVVHLLNHCARPTSDLYVEGLANFFLDDPFAYDAWLVVPTPQLQDELAERLLGTVSQRLQDRRYNMVAHARSPHSQNSNQWVLEILASAIENTSPRSDRRKIQKLPVMKSFRGDRIRISRWKRLGGIFQANVDFFDQPLGNRLNSRYEIITVRSVVRWLDSLGLVETEEVVAAPPVEPAA